MRNGLARGSLAPPLPQGGASFLPLTNVHPHSRNHDLDINLRITLLLQAKATKRNLLHLQHSSETFSFKAASHHHSNNAAARTQLSDPRHASRSKRHDDNGRRTRRHRWPRTRLASRLAEARYALTLPNRSAPQTARPVCNDVFLLLKRLQTTRLTGSATRLNRASHEKNQINLTGMGPRSIGAGAITVQLMSTEKSSREQKYQGGNKEQSQGTEKPWLQQGGRK